MQQPPSRDKMGGKSDNMELRLMALEQAISKQNIEISERLSKLEVKINILSYVSGSILTFGLVITAKLLLRF